jgi:hypothetical protein
MYDIPEYNKLRMSCDDYDLACRQTATNHVFMSGWGMLATAIVVGCPIQSVYPPRNSILDIQIGIKYQMMCLLQLTWSYTINTSYKGYIFGVAFDVNSTKDNVT